MKNKYNINAFDGFRVAKDRGYREEYAHEESNGEAVIVSLHLMGDGAPLQTIEVQAFAATTRGIGESERLVQFLTGLCDYLNTAGSVDELEEILRRLLPKLEPYSVHLPGDLYLMQIVSESSEHKYVFANDSGLIGVLEPDAYYEEMSIVDFNNDLDEALLDRNDEDDEDNLSALDSYADEGENGEFPFDVEEEDEDDEEEGVDLPETFWDDEDEDGEEE